MIPNTLVELYKEIVINSLIHKHSIDNIEIIIDYNIFPSEKWGRGGRYYYFDIKINDILINNVSVVNILSFKNDILLNNDKFSNFKQECRKYLNSIGSNDSIVYFCHSELNRLI